MEALTDDEAGLTYPALVGSRKQSVEDAERLFSPSLLKFMEKKGYTYEAKYISAILGWRQACDVRGLSALERCRRNYVLLNFILEELMPWSKETYDFSLFEVNRYNICMCLIFLVINHYTYFTGTLLRCVDSLEKFLLLLLPT